MQSNTLAIANTKNLIKGILLVSGTSIGGGMLALPVLTSQTGFFPSLLIYFLCWLFMACTGVLLLEICSWSKSETNIVSMAKHTLGSSGKWFAWVLYLFLFYCLTLAYVVGCGDLVNQLFKGLIPKWSGSILFVAAFAPLVFMGTKVAGRINMLLMLGLGISYCAFVALGYNSIKSELLFAQNWSASLLAFPIAFTAFAYQGIIPTLVTYMDRDILLTRKVIFIGSFIPFIVYLIWQGLILGVVPVTGTNGLKEALENGENAIQPLKYFINNPNIYVIGQFFAFFALVTSFLGVTLGLLDFLADGLNVKKTALGKLGLCLLIFIPPLLIAFTYPGIFLVALDFAGGIGCALLLGLLPIMMVWKGRYHLGKPSSFLLPGGKWLLCILAAFVFFELTIMLTQKIL